MRQFLVIGFKSTSNTDKGEIINLTADCAAAKALVSEPTEQYMRKEMHEIANPALRKMHATEEQVAEFEAKAAAKTTSKKQEKKS
jgi:glutamyl-tRNA reductase